MLEFVSIVGVAAAALALLAHIVLTLRAIREDVRDIARRVEEMQDDAE